jgi:hypothetical protein
VLHGWDVQAIKLVRSIQLGGARRQCGGGFDVSLFRFVFRCCVAYTATAAAPAAARAQQRASRKTAARQKGGLASIEGTT